MLLFLRQMFMMRALARVCVYVVVVVIVIVHWHCSAKWSMFNMEKPYRNKIIITIITLSGPTCLRPLCLKTPQLDYFTVTVSFQPNSDDAILTFTRTKEVKCNQEDTDDRKKAYIKLVNRLQTELAVYELSRRASRMS